MKKQELISIIDTLVKIQDNLLSALDTSADVEPEQQGFRKGLEYALNNIEREILGINREMRGDI